MNRASLLVTMQGYKNFLLAFNLLFEIRGKAIAYKVEDNNLVLYDFPETKHNAVILPYPMNAEQAAAFVWGWLQTVSPTTPEPCGDGDTQVGWEIKGDSGHAYDRNGGLSSEFHSFAVIRPVWFYFGK